MNKEIIEEVTDTDSSIELKEKINTVEKPKKERKPFVMTDARKEAFSKARNVRDENIKVRKAQQKQMEDELNQIKQEVVDKRNKRLIKKNKNEIKKIIKNEDLLSSSSDEEEIIIKKKHPKKKIIYIESESEDECEKYTKAPTYRKEPPRRIIQFL